jgi:hypothetical protein
MSWRLASGEGRRGEEPRKNDTESRERERESESERDWRGGGGEKLGAPIPKSVAKARGSGNAG